MSEPPVRTPARTVLAKNLKAVRLGHGANCSSIGSVVDTLFVSAAVGGALFAAVCAALADEPIRVVGVTKDAAARAAPDVAQDDGHAGASPDDEATP